MKYLCLVVIDEQKMETLSQSDGDALTEECLVYDEQIRQSGHLIVAHPIQSAQMATTLRVRNGKLSITDGPFAETNEQLGGFLLIEAADLNEAIHVASKCPMARVGAIEVRPITVLGRRIAHE